MKDVSTSTGLILLLSLTTGFITGQAQATSVLYGRVRDTLSEPIAKAQVRAYSKGVLVREAYTNEKGYYEMTGLPEGTLTITAWSLGFVTAKKEMKLKEGKKQELKFVLKAGSLSDSEEE